MIETAAKLSFYTNWVRINVCQSMVNSCPDIEHVCTLYVQSISIVLQQLSILLRANTHGKWDQCSTKNAQFMNTAEMENNLLGWR